jgi:hypothetical protein
VSAIELRQAPYHFQLWEMAVPEMELETSLVLPRPWLVNGDEASPARQVMPHELPAVQSQQFPAQ